VCVRGYRTVNISGDFYKRERKMKSQPLKKHINDLKKQLNQIKKDITALEKLFINLEKDL
jgi:archaellum component FlaC